jgi:hypothetical protein
VLVSRLSGRLLFLHLPGENFAGLVRIGIGKKDNAGIRAQDAAGSASTVLAQSMLS